MSTLGRCCSGRTSVHCRVQANWEGPKQPLCCAMCCAALQVGTFLQHTATFVAGFIIAFTRSWDMTLVLVGCLPFLAGVGGVLAKLVTKLSDQTVAAYTEV